MVTGHSLSAILPVRVQAAGSNGRSFVRSLACSHPKVITQGSPAAARRNSSGGSAPLASYIFMSICELNALPRTAAPAHQRKHQVLDAMLEKGTQTAAIQHFKQDLYFLVLQNGHLLIQCL
jgi:hypothetical protein